MISLEHSVSGGQLAYHLANDAEEAAYFFYSLIEDAPDNFGSEVAQYLDASRCQEVAALLTILAEQIGGAA